MLTQQNFDAVSAANYLDNYLECLETLPDKIQRHVSEIRRLDAQYYDGINKIQDLRREFLQICHPPLTSTVVAESATATVKEQKRIILQKVKYLLAQGQIISDEKLKQTASMYELLEQKWRSLDQDGKVLDFDCSESLLKPQSNGIISRSSPIHPSKILDHDSIGINGNLVLRSERRQAIEESDSPTIVASTSSSTRQSNSNHKRARRQKQFPDFVRETDVGTNEPQATTSRRDRASASVASTTSSTATTATVTPTTTTAATTASATASSASSGTSAATTSNNKRRRKLQTGANSGGGGGAWNGAGSSSSRSTKFNVPVEPDEPTYCLCEQVSYGEMIGCDNTDCEIEWFHFNCVSLSVKPKGKWFCPNCRGERSNVMKE